MLIPIYGTFSVVKMAFKVQTADSHFGQIIHFLVQYLYFVFELCLGERWEEGRMMQVVGQKIPD